jgi:hypothetical protein
MKGNVLKREERAVVEDDKNRYDQAEEELDDEYYGDEDEDNNYVKLSLEFDGTSFTLKLTTKKVPGVKQSGQIWAKKTGRKYSIDFGLGDQEFDEKDVPNPIRTIIDSKGGGPSGYQVKFPPRGDVVRDDYTLVSYPEYASRWKSRRLEGKEKMEKPFTKELYKEVGKLYLKLLGVPLYL